MAEDLRVYFYHDDAMYYRFTDTEVIISRILPGARDMRTLRFGEP